MSSPDRQPTTVSGVETVCTQSYRKPTMGIEPITARLQGGSSAIELRRRNQLIRCRQTSECDYTRGNHWRQGYGPNIIRERILSSGARVYQEIRQTSMAFLGGKARLIQSKGNGIKKRPFSFMLKVSRPKQKTRKVKMESNTGRVINRRRIFAR